MSITQIPGLHLKNYHLTVTIATSAFSYTFRGEDTSSVQRQAVVLKYFHTAQVDTAQKKGLFRNDIQLLQQLQHPHIVPILALSLEQEKPYIVTTYLQGSSLADRIQEYAYKPFPLTEALKILQQTGQALHFAHQKGIAHGHLKPTDILIGEDGRVFITDFRPSVLQTILPTDEQESNVYQAPEQRVGKGGRRSDIFSLGCIAYELITGRKPFTSPSLNNPGTYFRMKTLLEPTKLIPDLPQNISQAILKATARDPRLRYKTVQEFLLALGILPAEITSVATSPQNAEGLAIQKEEPSALEEHYVPQFPVDFTRAQTTTVTLPFAVETSHHNLHSSLQEGSLLVETENEHSELLHPLPPIGKSSTQHPGFHWHLKGSLLALSLLLISLTILGTFLFAPFLLPGASHQTHSNGQQKNTKLVPYPSPTATLQAANPAFAPSSTLPPNEEAKQPPLVVPTATPVPTRVPRPSPTAVSSSNALTLFPTQFDPSTCIAGKGVYTCTTVLSLSSDAQGSIQWQAMSKGVSARFMPAKGSLSAGDSALIVINVYNRCPRTGTFIFMVAGGADALLATWSCN